MMQYLPMDGLYVYFRYDNKQTVMCIMNTAKESKKINFADYDERTKGFITAASITTKENYKTSETLTVPAQTMWVLEMK